MLFTTAVFALLFLPVVLVGFYAAPGPRLAAGWLFLSSLFFYGFWMPEFTLLLLASILTNFVIGTRIAARVSVASQTTAGTGATAARVWLVLGVSLNLLALSYFKYANFFVDNVEAALGTQWHLMRVVLPIGISFYTFTQIAFLVDAYRGRVRDYHFVHYGLFVTYFPHLIAGPILHHSQMMPQFAKAQTYRFEAGHFAAGLAIFGLGLIKKVIFADGVGPYADAVFNPVDAGHLPEAGEAWLGACAYTLQLYFDFSGYSDMAIGLSWMFNIRLPINFNSPYRATDISDFWRRWHISLSNFLRDYLYVALGGNRHGAARRYANLLTTMLLGGLWHGASWTFVFWGGLHGLYLVVNHAFRALINDAVHARLRASRIFTVSAWALTMLAVIVGWVFFRAATFGGALRMLEGMFGMTVTHAAPELMWDAGLSLAAGWRWCLVLGVVALLPANSNRIAEGLLHWCKSRAEVRAFVMPAALLAVLSLILINTARDSTSAFIYFNF